MPSLVRASDFCRPRRRHGPQADDHPAREENGLVVTVKIFRDGTLPRSGRKDSISNANADRTVYAHPALFCRANAMANRPGRMTVSKRSLVVLMQVLPFSRHDDNNDKHDHQEDACRDEEDATTVWISRVTAFYLGLDDNSNNNRALQMDRNQQQQQQQQQQPTWTAQLTPCLETEIATTSSDAVVLRLWGRPLPPISSLLQDSSSSTRTTTMQPSLPPCGSLLQDNQLVLVHDKGATRQGESNLPAICFYQVLLPRAAHDDDDDEDDDDDNEEIDQDAVMRTTRDTEYKVVVGGAACPRLPPLLDAQLLLVHDDNDDNNNNDNNNNTTTVPPRRQRPPHPDVPGLVQRLGAMGHSSSAASLVNNEAALRVMPVVAADKDPADALVALRAAADQLGRSCLVVSGLAAYAHLHRSNDTSRRGSTLWQDKLCGLEMAYAKARVHAPSLLVLANMDQEVVARDTELARDQASRLVHLLLSLLSASSSSFFHDGKKKKNSMLPSVPPVLVVLTTTSNRTKSDEAAGTTSIFDEFLIHRPYAMSVPDQNYIHYLWQQQQQQQQHDATDQDASDQEVPSSNATQLLLGRTAAEIMTIRRHVAETRRSSTGTPDEGALVEICAQMDQGQGSSRTTKIPSVHWDQIGGLSHVRREILQALEWPLSFPHLFPTPETRRRGILLYGPPGTGKTLVAKAVATECRLPFLSVKGPELLGSYVGESEAQVRAVFAEARRWSKPNRPSVLFFDELDSLVPRRGDGGGAGGNVMERVASTLLSELDGNNTKPGWIFLLGATNRPDLLDPALLRPGRLDRLVYLGVDHGQAVSILATQLKKLTLSEGRTATEMAQAVAPQLEGKNLTGADLSTIVTGALLTATERLCAQADEEVLLVQERQDRNTTVDEILASWKEDQLVPIVTLEDLVRAASRVVPSVSLAELETYERHQREFRQDGGEQI